MQYANRARKPTAVPQWALALLMAGACTQSEPALAVNSNDENALRDTGTLEEIVVTAQKREGNLQNVGTSITALTAAALEEGNLTSATDVAAMTPGLQFNQFSPTITVYNLRGVSQNDFSDHQEAPVAVYVDDAYVASMGALAGTMFDMNRVEILRGPQGTLFGRNATGGLIHYISKKPEFDSSGYLSVTGGNFDTLNTQGAINGALSDSVAGRLSFSTDHHGAYMDNRIGPDPGNQQQYAVRAQLLIVPSPNGEIVLNIHGVKNDNENSGAYSWATAAADATTGLGAFTPGQPDLGGYVNPSNDPFSQAQDGVGKFNRDMYGFTGHVNWKFDGFDFTSVTDYLHLKKSYGEDSDMSPNPLFNYNTHQKYHQFSEELRLNGQIDATRWITGLYFLDYRTDNENLVDLTNLGAIPGGAIYSLSTKAYSIFGQVERDFSDAWTVIGGARYGYDSKQFDFAETDPFGDGTPFVYGDDHGWSNINAKLELDRKIGGNAMAYATVTRGAKGGGWSAPTIGTPDPDRLRFDQEKLTSYEIGLKSEFWDHRARLNTAVFYYDYKNYQGFVVQGLVQVVVNLQSTVKGAEVELALTPIKHLNVELGISALDTEAKKVPLPGGVLLSRELPQAPKFTVNGSIRYEWTLPSGYLFAGADAKWNSDQYLELINSSVDLQRAYVIANARAGYRSGDDRWGITGFVRNATDTRYRVYNLDLAASLGITESVYGPPRTYGVELSYNWGK